MQVVGELRDLLALRGFRRLFTVRLVSQAGDGMFQIGLATLFFFSPQRMATAGGVASAFAVLLLPFTVVGPFAGPLLDRWRRRQVLAIGNGVRLLLTLALAVVVVSSGVTPAVSVLALVTLGVNRFLLSALSAGLPRVVPADRLLIANSLTPTLGAASTVAGAAAGLVVGQVLPAGGLHDGVVLALAAVAFGAAGLLALRLGADQLGPDRTGPSTGVLADVAATAGDLVAGTRYLVARRTPAAALAQMGAHRFLYGVNVLALILISRNLLSDPHDVDAGLRTFATLTGLSFAGNGLAVLVTPIAQHAIEPARWILACLGLGAVSQLVMLVPPGLVVTGSAAVLLGLSVQGAKIAADTIVQRDTADEVRGRAFALYDVVYNAAFVGAAALSAALLPDTGWSRSAFALLAAAFVLVALAYGRVRTAPGSVPAAAAGPGRPAPAAVARPGGERR